MRVPALLLFIAITTLVPTGAGQLPEGDFTMLHIQDYKYLPDPLEVTPGLTVVVMSFPDTNKTAAQTEPHTVTDVRCPASSPCDSFDVQNIQADGSQHPFTAPTEPGEYPYFCRYHGDRNGGGMVGTLIVTPASATTTTTATPTATPAGGTTSTPASGSSDTPMGAWVAAIALGVAVMARRRV